jgi:hypothetical protein
MGGWILVLDELVLGLFAAGGVGRVGANFVNQINL